jgi:hypothetical protein
LDLDGREGVLSPSAVFGSMFLSVETSGTPMVVDIAVNVSLSNVAIGINIVKSDGRSEVLIMRSSAASINAKQPYM